MTRTRLALVLTIALVAIELAAAGYQSSVTGNRVGYFPSRDNWERRKPADVGMDGTKLSDAIEFMKANETTTPARDFSDQEIIFGKLLRSIRTERGATNSLVIWYGYIVAEIFYAARPDSSSRHSDNTR